MKWKDWQNKVTEKTEKVLTWRKKRKLKRKARQKRKGQIRDWLEALLWAVVFVLILNQYLLQAYAIPTGSMEDTILGEDRIFVNKIVYGPELIPGQIKISGFAEPVRGEIVIFENPNYEKEMGRPVGALEQIIHRIVYMITFSLWNMDMNTRGQPAHHFLVKRLIALPGERIRFREGRVEIMPEAEVEWVSEQRLKQESLDFDYKTKMVRESKYPEVKAYCIGKVLSKMGLPVSMEFQNIEQMYNTGIIQTYRYKGVNLTQENFNYVPDINYSILDIEYEKYWYYRTQFSINPFSVDSRSGAVKALIGKYVPVNRFFPMGDNRNNSRDARYFGAVKLDKLLGRALFRFWPLDRLGGVQ